MWDNRAKRSSRFFEKIDLNCKTLRDKISGGLYEKFKRGALVQHFIKGVGFKAGFDEVALHWSVSNSGSALRRSMSLIWDI